MGGLFTAVIEILVAAVVSRAPLPPLLQELQKTVWILCFWLSQQSARVTKGDILHKHCSSLKLVQGECHIRCSNSTQRKKKRKKADAKQEIAKQFSAPWVQRWNLEQL